MAVSHEISEALRIFVANANWSVLHPLDDDRFDDALILAHTRRETLSPNEIRETLVDHGAPDSDEVLHGLIVRWEQGTDLLKRYDSKR